MRTHITCIGDDPDDFYAGVLTTGVLVREEQIYTINGRRWECQRVYPHSFGHPIATFKLARNNPCLKEAS